MEKTGMTQNDKDLEVIDIVQDNYHKKETIIVLID